MLVTGDLDGATVECAGALVAREHAAARQVRPELPAGFGSAEVCAARGRAAAPMRQRPSRPRRDRQRAHGTGALHRGLVVPCSECERRALPRIELPGEKHLPAARTPAPVLPGDPTWTSRNGSMTCTARSGNSPARTATCRSWPARRWQRRPPGPSRTSPSSASAAQPEAGRDCVMTTVVTSRKHPASRSTDRGR